MDERLEAAQILEDAADLLLVHGRCTGHGLDPDGRMCVRGAIRAALGEDPAETFFADSPADAALEQRLACLPLAEERLRAWEAVGPGGAETADACRASGRFPSWLWNDHQDTTDDEVRDTLLLVAKDLRNEATA